MDQTTYRLPRRSLLVVAVFVTTSLLAPAGGQAGATGAGAETSAGTEASDGSETSEACVGSNLIGHSRPFLTGFTVLNPASPFYAAPENGTLSTTLTVTPTDQCDGQEEPGGRARYLTEEGSAVSPDDHEAIGPEWSDYMCVVNDTGGPHRVCAAGTQRTRTVPLTFVNDSTTEPAVESFNFEIVGGDPFPPATFRTTEAPVHIIDDDGSGRVSLEPTLSGGQTLRYQSGEPSLVEIPVFWAGSGTPGNVNFTVGPGNPAPTEDVDYRVESTNPLPESTFTRAGGRLAFIRIRILNNVGSDGKLAKELDEVISIQLDPSGVTPYEVEEAHDSTTLTILDGGSDTAAPRTRFHHPKHKKKYRKNAYQLREMHVFYREPGGSGIRRVQLAIQRKKKNGTCQWWNGRRFRPGRCNRVPGKFWKKTKYAPALDWFLYRVPAFKSTVGTNIRFYRGWARGFDHAGNVETRFQKNRNKNKFWIKKR